MFALILIIEEYRWKTNDEKEIRIILQSFVVIAHIISVEFYGERLFENILYNSFLINKPIYLIISTSIYHRVKVLEQ